MGSVLIKEGLKNHWRYLIKGNKPLKGYIMWMGKNPPYQIANKDRYDVDFEGLREAMNSLHSAKTIDLFIER